MKPSKPASTLLLLALLAAPLAAQEGSWTSIGPDGGNVLALAAAPSRPDRLYAALGNGGIYKSLDRGQTWALAGWSSGLSDLAVDLRNPNVIYGTGDFTLLRSPDGGATWRILRRDYPDDRLNGIEINPHNGVIFTFGQTYLSRSADGGASWDGSENGLRDVQAVAFDPVRPNVVYAAGPQGLFRSGNGGRTWRPWGQGIPAGTALRTLAIDPRDPRTPWAGAARWAYSRAPTAARPGGRASGGCGAARSAGSSSTRCAPRSSTSSSAMASSSAAATAAPPGWRARGRASR
jgi:hypothetical protein